MSSYRDKWFRNNKPFFGRYRCVHCGRWFVKEDIDIDHIIPKKYGGTDALVNLQPLCKHCNRSKKESMKKTAPDLLVNSTKVGLKTIAKGIFK